MSDANNRQVAGDHYKSEYQHWDWARDINLSSMPYQTSKYLSRWRKKNGVQDLEKALHFFEKHIENEKERCRQILDKTDAYIAANDFNEMEKELIHGCSMVHFPDIRLLETIAQRLRRAVEMQKEQV